MPSVGGVKFKYDKAGKAAAAKAKKRLKQKPKRKKM